MSKISTFGDQSDFSLKKKRILSLQRGKNEGKMDGCKGQLKESLVCLSDTMDGENDQLLSDIFIRDNVSEVEWVGNMAFTWSLQ